MAEASGIPAKALRSLGVGTDNLSEKEKFHRERNRQKILSEILPYEEVVGKPGILPGLGPHVGFPTDMQRAIRVPRPLLMTLSEKIARGLEFKIAGRYVGPPYVVTTFFPRSDAVEAAEKKLAGGHQRYFGPGFSVYRIAASDHPEAVLYRMVIWGTLTIHVAIDELFDAPAAKQ